MVAYMILTFNNFFYPITCLFRCLSLQNFNAVGKNETKGCWFICLIILNFLDTCEWETTLYLYLKNIYTMSVISGTWEEGLINDHQMVMTYVAKLV